MKRATLAIVAAFAAIVATAETSRTATENWTRNRIDEATNATLQAAKEYADAHGGDVQSVNGKTGTVVLAAADVHARPDTWVPTPEAVGAVPVYNGNIINPKIGSPEILGDIKIGYGALPGLLNILNNGRLYVLDWGKIVKGNEGGANNQTLGEYVEEIAGKPTNLWNGASTKYMNVNGEVWVYTNYVYYTSNMNPDPLHNMYPAGDGIWQTEDISYSYTCRVRWDGETFHWAWYENGGWLEYDTSPTYLNLESQDIYTTIASCSYHRNVRAGWMKTKQVAYTEDLSGYVPTTRKINGQPLTGDIEIAAGITPEQVDAKIAAAGHATPATVDAKIAAAGHMTRTEADAAYYPKDQGQAWSTYWDGDDVRVTVTNYDSVANLPSLYLEQRTNQTAQATNAFKIVWREMAHWERFLGTNWNWNAQWDGFKTWAANIASQIAQKADRAWGYFDSHTGNYAPDGYTSISSANVMLCKDASYQKTLTTAGEVWVLTANDPYEPTGVSTNGGFQIKDHEGNVQFEIVKGDKVTVKAQANAVTVENGTTLVVTYNIIAGSHPTGEVCLDLANPTWKTETAAGCPATVVWSGTSGNYVARITPTGAAATKCFFKATYQRGGETYINNRCAVGMSQIVLNGNTYNLGTATISGSTVLTLTPAN